MKKTYHGCKKMRTAQGAVVALTAVTALTGASEYVGESDVNVSFNIVNSSIPVTCSMVGETLQKSQVKPGAVVATITCTNTGYDTVNFAPAFTFRAGSTNNTMRADRTWIGSLNDAVDHSMLILGLINEAGTTIQPVTRDEVESGGSTDVAKLGSGQSSVMRMVINYPDTNTYAGQYKAAVTYYTWTS
ncbi:hypothetical protein C1366_26740 [Salmonella enterica]|nr:hypothetical protein [Salmonella enterica]